MCFMSRILYQRIILEKGEKTELKIWRRREERDYVSSLNGQDYLLSENALEELSKNSSPKGVIKKLDSMNYELSRYAQILGFSDNDLALAFAQARVRELEADRNTQKPYLQKLLSEVSPVPVPEPKGGR